MAHTKAQKTARGNKDSQPKRLGVKIYGRQKVSVGNIIVRQRGTRYHASKGTKRGGDDTIYAVANGLVQFSIKNKKKYVSVVTPV